MSERLVILVVGLLMLASSGCGYFAEVTRPKRDDIMLHGGECVYPMSPAFVLGLVGVALLLLAVRFITGCCRGCCCKRRDGVSTVSFALGILLAVVSWLTALYAALFFLVAVAAIRPGRPGKAPECYAYVHADHIFQQAATLAILAGHHLRILLLQDASQERQAPHRPHGVLNH